MADHTCSAEGASNICLSVLRVSQRPGNRRVYQFSSEGRGIRREADVCSCRPDYGVEWMAGKHAEFLCTGSVARVTGGLQQARVVAGEVGWGIMT